MTPPKPERRRYPAAAAGYIPLIGILRSIAREHGYALAVHGSLATDLDLVAAPWVDEATDADTLIEALRKSVDGVIVTRHPSCGPCQERGIAENCEHVNGLLGCSNKPHGRRAWSIYLSPEAQGPYLDISVMPRLPSGI